MTNPNATINTNDLDVLPIIHHRHCACRAIRRVAIRLRDPLIGLDPLNALLQRDLGEYLQAPEALDFGITASKSAT